MTTAKSGRDVNLRHIAHVLAICDCGYSVSKAANRLGIAQSVLSRNIRSLENHFGQPLFVRSGKRLSGITPLCEELLYTFREIGVRIDNINALAAGRRTRVEGSINIACTHLQARYLLPAVFAALRRNYPSVTFSIQQDLPAHINDLIVSNRADLGICSEKLCDEPALVTHDAYEWERVLIAPKRHPILTRPAVRLADLAREPLITYIPGITGRGGMDAAFRAKQLEPNVVVAAADSDVIKEFARNGHGIGVIASIAFEEADREHLGMRRIPKLFKPMRTRVVHRRDRVLSRSQEEFIRHFCEVAARKTEEIALWEGQAG